MTISSIADFINRLQSGVHRRIKSDGIVGSKNIIINCTGNSNDRNFMFGPKGLSTFERTVTADADKRIDALGF